MPEEYISSSMHANSTMDISSDPTNSPFNLRPSDNPGLVLISCLITGDNFITWQHAMKNALRAKKQIPIC
uniref:Retrotransposon Copia-like N-terminal domain-containing protein n=1 Tax=Nelumbo nucifera TaxID=4432 RepID=A0A822XMR1_NELNU|nr:TPA_asm: hypothetical protein HUJ06_021812 [Nelumbo nucifera]